MFKSVLAIFISVIYYSESSYQRMAGRYLPNNYLHYILIPTGLIYNSIVDNDDFACGCPVMCSLFVVG